jgi:malonyl CoA-acyl carrier protein transacylase/NADP-dependent 3-hydroxy acid dehydrogenase YdfG/acyl carrier protein
VVPWLVSARSEAAVRAQAGRLAGFARAAADPRLVTDAGFVLATGRARLEYRAAVAGATAAQIADGLAELADGGGTVTRAAPGGGTVAVLFTGQGSQRAGMGRGLYAAFPVFAAAFEAAARELDQAARELALRPGGPGTVPAGPGEAPGGSLREVMWDGPGELLGQTGWAQPALFAFETALFALLASWGITPAYLAGHSVGEITAAHVAGILSLPDAARLVTARGQLMQALPPGGAMAAVTAAETDVLPLLGQDLAIAAVNGPASVVISGPAPALATAATRLQEAGHRVTPLRVSHAFHSPLMDPVLCQFAEITASLAYHPPVIPVISTVTGAQDPAIATPGYWVRQVREPVRFADAVTHLAARHVTIFVEAGPDAALSALGPAALPGTSAAVFLAACRRGHDEEHHLVTALAQAYAHGAAVDWPAFYAPHHPQPADLPTYPFQHQRYWQPETAAPGLTGVGHPLLDAAVELADSGSLVLTGRLSAADQPWLAGHLVGEAMILPGTGFVELAGCAADQTGCQGIEELTLAAPLVLPANGAVAIQVTVGVPAETGARAVAIHSRPDGTDLPWTRHAQGILTLEGAIQPADLTQWPPAGAQAVPLDGGYDRLAERGYGYGSIFRAVSAVWQRGDELFAEVTLPPQAHADAERYRLHPALLDAALHPMALADGQDSESAVLPFSFGGVTLAATGARAVRVRITATGPMAVSVDLADLAGLPVASIRSLALREISPGQLSASSGSDTQYYLRWVPAPSAVSVASAGADWAFADFAAPSVPEIAVLPCARAVPDVMTGVRSNLSQVLTAIQRWLADERFARSRLAILTREADLGQAPVWGLVRAAQAENPDRFLLVDIDDTLASQEALPMALASGEPELRIKDGRVLVPRLVRRRAGADHEPVLDPTGTVLITGGTGGLGALVASHLVTRHGVRHLILASRQGTSAPGAEKLRAELAALGADVLVASCDVADRAALAGLIGSVDQAHPLTGVVHAAGAVADNVVGSLSPERMETSLRSKAESAWYLHELTEDRPLAAFVTFSSAGGLALAGGQGSYAAANVFLDALCAHRRQRGLAATSIAYGLWDIDAGLTQWLTEADVQRMARQGFGRLSVADGLAAFDTALAADDPLLVSVKLDLAAVRARAGQLPAVLRGFDSAARRRSAHGPAVDPGRLSSRLAGLDEAEQERELRELVQGCSAAILGFAAADAVDPERDFLETGFDSLAAVELRNQLNAATGLQLPPTVVFDEKSPAALARYMRAELAAGQAGVPAARGDKPDTLAQLFSEAVLSDNVLKGFDLLRAVAELRPRFDTAAGFGAVPAGVRLADGPGFPCLIGISTPMATGGPHQHARLAARFRGIRPMVTLTNPGFIRGEPLPSSVDAVIDVLAEGVVTAADGRPFVLVGYSSGGVLAYATAGHLESAGVRPAGVVLLDTYRVDTDDADQARLMEQLAIGLVQKDSQFGLFHSSALSAMNRYFDLVPRFRLGKVAAPVLFVGASQSFMPETASEPDDQTWRATPWEPEHTYRTIAATHFSLIETEAAAAAEVIEEWLGPLGDP